MLYVYFYEQLKIRFPFYPIEQFTVLDRLPKGYRALASKRGWIRPCNDKGHGRKAFAHARSRYANYPNTSVGLNSFRKLANFTFTLNCAL
jgi:hypothetical protein